MTDSTTEQAKIDRDAALKKAYQTATKRLRDKRRDEFNDLYSEEAKALGYEWKPKQTAEEKAAEAYQRPLTEYPHLAQTVGEPQYAAPVPASEDPALG